MARERNAGLVREFIEKISGSMLEDQYRPAVGPLIPRQSGNYAHYKRDRLY
jgi:hypothetical protein